MATAIENRTTDTGQSVSTEGTGQIKITLTTRDESVAVPDVPLLVPLSLKRYGLSEVVNHLLATGMIFVPLFIRY